MIKYIDSHFILKLKRSTKFSFVAPRKPSSRPRTSWFLYFMASLASLDQI